MRNYKNLYIKLWIYERWKYARKGKDKYRKIR